MTPHYLRNEKNPGDTVSDSPPHVATRYLAPEAHRCGPERMIDCPKPPMNTLEFEFRCDKCRFTFAGMAILGRQLESAPRMQVNRPIVHSAIRRFTVPSFCGRVLTKDQSRFKRCRPMTLRSIPSRNDTTMLERPMDGRGAWHRLCSCSNAHGTWSTAGEETGEIRAPFDLLRLWACQERGRFVGSTRNRSPVEAATESWVLPYLRPTISRGLLSCLVIFQVERRRAIGSRNVSHQCW